VHAEEALRPVHGRGQRPDRDRRRVGGDHRAVGDQPRNAGEDGALDLDVLRDRLDDERGVGGRLGQAGGGEPLGDRLLGAGREEPPLDVGAGQRQDRRHAELSGRLVDVGDGDARAGQGQDLADAAAHVTAAEHAHALIGPVRDHHAQPSRRRHARPSTVSPRGRYSQPIQPS
jgi:hypothetical protein